jgi:biotin transport system substrate-specific component
MKQNIVGQLKMIVFASLFTALYILGAYVAVPIGPVPITLQNLFVFLAALLLGSRWGTLSVIVYILLGLVGLPVFSKGGASLAHILGPTGGFLIGFAVAVFFAGLISERGKQSAVKNIIALLVAVILIYAVGVPWLKFRIGMDWDKAVFAGMLPFLPGDAVKLAAAVLIAKFVKPFIDGFVSPKQKDA